MPRTLGLGPADLRGDRLPCLPSDFRVRKPAGTRGAKLSDQADIDKSLREKQGANFNDSSSSEDELILEGNAVPKYPDFQDGEGSVPAKDHRRWYIIHTYSRHERKVELTLQGKNIESFLPRLTVSSRRRDRRLLIKVPLFPGYLFVHTDLNDWAYYTIIKNPSVVRILGSKGRCKEVPEETVTSIQTLLNSGQPVFPWAKLTPGKQVRVVEGPLAGAIGVIARSKLGKRRLVVRVELLGRRVSAELAEESVEADG
jgi:transcription termination/antitermination protein NusG